ncbi:MAG: phosphate-starvation-inducible PsiE family protein [Pseudonocardiales bacterium]
MPSQPREKLGPFMQRALSWFEAVLYGIVALLLVAAAALVLIGTVEAIIQALTTDLPALEGGILVLDRILLILIVAEFAYTLRVVIEKHEISAEPFLFIGLIAVVRRILIVTAEFEQPQTDAQLNSLLLELGMLGVLVLGLATAIFLIRRSSARGSPQPPTAPPLASEH